MSRSPARSAAHWVVLAGVTVALTALAAEALVRLTWSAHHPREAYVRTAFESDIGLVHLSGRHLLTFRRCLADAPGCETVRVRFSINNQGFRGLRDVRDPPGDPLIVVLGDSMIEGAQVDDEETACHLLEERLRLRRPDVEVRNLGITSAGLVHYYLRARRPFARAATVLVVAVLGINDFRNSSPSLETFPPMRPHYEGGGESRRVHFENPPRARRLLDRSEALRMLTWVRSAEGVPPARFFKDAAIYEEPPSPEMAEAIDLGREYLRRLIRGAADRGTRVLVVYLPWRGEYVGEEWSALVSAYPGTGVLRKERPAELVREAAVGAGAAFASLGDGVRSLPRAEVAQLWHRGADAHFTVAGHRLLARFLEQAMEPLLEPGEGPDRHDRTPPPRHRE